MLMIASGVTDQVITFYAVDATDLITPETGLSGFTVYRSRNGGTPAAFTTPTVTELSSSNMPGWYKLLLDEDMTIDSGDESQDFALHITCSGMHPVKLKFILFRPKITAGETLSVSSGALAAIADGLITAAKIASDAFTAAKFASDFLTAAKVASDVGTEIATAVWASATRLLTAGTNIVLAKGTGVTGFTDLDDAGVRDAVGLASANLDTQLGAIAAKTTNLPSDPADESLIIAATDAIMTRLGAPVGADLSGDIAAIKSDTGAILTDTGTTLQTVVDAIEADTQDIQARLPAALTGDGNMKADVLKIEGADPTDTIRDSVVDDATKIDGSALNTLSTGATFSVAGKLDANITHVNEVAVTGDGQLGTEWGPA